MSAASQYADQIAGALDQTDTALTISGVKDAVRAELCALDPTMEVETTQYFNHSFSPDFVASWPSDPSKSRRYIYLKTSGTLDLLLDDLSLIEDQHPIVFRLSPASIAPDRLTRAAQEESKRTDTLLTDASGLEQLITHNKVPFIGLTGTAVAQGGRGLMDAVAGEETASRLTSGFEGALAVDPVPTLAATETLDEVLAEKHADRMSRLLQAVWVGAGGRLEDFPGGQVGSAAGITDEALEFLFNYDDIPESRFWRRLGHQTSLQQLGRLPLKEATQNLQRFVKANIGQLNSRACRVVKQEQLTTSQIAPEDFTWFIDRDRRLLALHGPGFIAYFGSNVSDLGHAGRKIRGIGLGELAQRTAYSTVTEAEIVASAGRRRTLKLTSGDGSNLTDDLLKRKTFPELGAGAIPIVRRIGVALDGGPDARVLTCDFETSTAYRRTSSKISLSEIAGDGIPLLYKLDETAVRKLAALIDNDEAPGLAYTLTLVDALGGRDSGELDQP